MLLYLTHLIPLQNAHFTELKMVYCQRFQLILMNLSLLLLFRAIYPFLCPTSCSAGFQLQRQMLCFRQCLTSAHNYLMSNMVLLCLCPFSPLKDISSPQALAFTYIADSKVAILSYSLYLHSRPISNYLQHTRWHFAEVSLFQKQCV